MKWTLINQAGTNDPETGDIYSGLDRFGRVKDNRWIDGAGADLDRIQYGYDRASNRIWRKNVVADSLGKHFDELYGNDVIQRLKDMDRGTLTELKDAVTDKTFAQCWSLDPTGNWKKFLEDSDGSGIWDLNQSRSANTVNEITEVSEITGPSWVTPAYNRVGNMTTMPKVADPTVAQICQHDAWNRLTKVSEGANTVAEYRYDGAKRRIVQKSYESGVLSETRHLHYTEPSRWQVIEERLGTSPDSADAERQFVWGLRYIDDLVLRDRDTDGDSTLDERLYACQDANWNVTSVFSASSVVQERYAYTSYGHPSFLTSSLITHASSVVSWNVLYAGYRWDTPLQLYHIRNRMFHSPLGKWLQRDPLGMAAGTNVYAYCSSNPYRCIDPTGLNWVCDLVSHPITNCLCAFLQLVDTALSLANAILGPTFPLVRAAAIAVNLMDCLCDIGSIISLTYCCQQDPNLIGIAGNAASCVFDAIDIWAIFSVGRIISDIAQAIAQLITWYMGEVGPDAADQMGSIASCVSSIL